jgi:outer membrane receptor protein involved in Fe transport
VQVDWSVATAWGRLALNQYVTYVDRYEQLEPNGATVDRAGTIGANELGGAIPRWKALLDCRLQAGALGLFARWQHVGGMQDAGAPEFEVPSRDYLDLGAGYHFGDGFLDGLAVGVGVENVGDEQPPLFPSWQQANTDPSQYDVLGRRYYVNLRYRF